MPQGLPHYDELVKGLETERRLQAGHALNVDAERATRVLKLRGQTGLPHEVIDGDLDYIEQQTELRQFDPKKYRQTNRKWAEFAAENPYHLAVLKDDEENMTRFEWAMDALFDWSAVGKAAHSSFVQQEIGMIGDRQRRGDFKADDAERLKELRKYSVGHDFDTSGLKSLVISLTLQSANIIKSTEAGLHRAKYTGPLGAAIGAQYGAAGGTVILPGGGTAVGAGAVGVFGYGVGFTVGMIQGRFEYSRNIEAGGAYLEYRDLGFTHEDAAWAATIAGNINGLLEAVGGQVVFSKLPGIRSVSGKVGDEVVKQLMGRTTFRQVAGKAVRDWGIGVSAEIITEIGQEATTIVMGEILKGQAGRDDQLTSDEVYDRITDIAVETLKSTVLLAGLGPGQRLFTDGRRAHRGKQMQQAFKAMGESTEAAKIKAELPDKWREWVNKFTKDGTVKNILIDIGHFREYFQGVGKDPDQVADELGIDLEKAEVEGNDIEISLTEYVDQIAGTEHHAGLAKDIKTENQMSLREAEQWDKDQKEIIETISSGNIPEGYSPAPEIFEAIKGEQIANGLDVFAAEKVATLNEYVFSTLAKRSNMEPMELFDRYWGGIRRDIPEVLQRKDVDVAVDSLLNRLRKGDVPGQRDIFGESLTDFLKSKGGLQDEGGEFAAQDAKEQIPGLIKQSGLTTDAAAELAAEAGFIAEFDFDQLREAVVREIRGEPVFGRGADPMVADLARSLDELSDFLEQEGIDLEKMSNAEVRKQLLGVKTLNQEELDEVLELAIASAAHDPALLSRALVAMPGVADVQDFGKLTFVDRVAIEGLAETVEIKEDAQRVFDRAVKRRGVIERLLDCVSG